MLRRLVIFVTCLSLAVASTADEKPLLQVTAGKKETKVIAEPADGFCTIDIQSPTGIDQITISRTSDSWPEKLHLRLHLRGLEQLTIKHGGCSLQWHVSSTEAPKSRQFRLDGNQELEVTATDAFYAEVKIVGKQPSIPLKDGYFELQVPPKVFMGNPKQLQIAWIDFFR